MWWNWYNFKALFRKIFRGRQKTGQNITLVLDKRHFEIKPSLTETYSWTLRFHINKIVTTSVENTTNDRLLTVISQNKYLFNASQKFQVQYAANVDNTDRTVYVTVAEEDGRFWLAKCCRRLFWLSRATISKCKEKFQSVNQTDRILVISIISMISSVSFVGHSCRSCLMDVPVARLSSAAHSGLTSSVRLTLWMFLGYLIEFRLHAGPI